MNPNSDSIQELIQKIKTGELYGEIQQKLNENLKKRKHKNTPRDKKIIQIQEKISKKEIEIEKLLNEIIRLKNELSKLLEEELWENK